MIAWNPRFAPPIALVLLVVIKMFWPGFLASGPFDSVAWLAWLSWWLITFLVLGLVTAWLLTPGFVRLVVNLGRIGLVPPILFLLIFVSGLWLGDTLWNGIVRSIWEGLPEARLLATFTAAALGVGSAGGAA